LAAGIRKVSPAASDREDPLRAGDGYPKQADQYAPVVMRWHVHVVLRRAGDGYPKRADLPELADSLAGQARRLAVAMGGRE
jgi:hypothetical protein